MVTERALLRLQTYQAIRDGILCARYHPDVLLSAQLQMREMLECFALRVASRTIPAEKLRELDALFARYQAADAIRPEEKERLFAGDTALHAMIVAAAGNERMIKTLEPMQAQILRVRSLSWSTPGRVARACCEHR